MPERPSALARFIGAAMMAVGVLVTLLSGGCTGVLLFANLTSIVHGADPSFVFTALLVGTPFIAIGIGLFFGGRAISRGSDD